MEAWPHDRTKRSRFGQRGFPGLKRRNRDHRVWTTGARAIGVPGWPELATWTASMARVRMVLMTRRSADCGCGDMGLPPLWHRGPVSDFTCGQFATPGASDGGPLHSFHNDTKRANLQLGVGSEGSRAQVH